MYTFYKTKFKKCIKHLNISGGKVILILVFKRYNGVVQVSQRIENRMSRGELRSHKQFNFYWLNQLREVEA